MSVITISRESGSLGENAARIIADKLRFHLMDREALEKIIEGEKFPDVPLERFDEQSPSFWEYFTGGKDVYLDRLRTAVLESAVSGGVVILGRGANFILEGIPGTLRVRIIASPDIRYDRISDKLKCDQKTAERYCRKSDHDRNGYCRFFFGGHWAGPENYDLTLSTDLLDAEYASEIIFQAYKASPAAKTSPGMALKNRLTSQTIRNRILYVHRIPVDLLEVETDGGHVTVRGTVTVRENARRCEDAVKEVEGVTSVEAEVYFVNPVMTY
jgi:cytidylate kinase